MAIASAPSTRTRRIMNAIDPQRIIGCVVYPAAGIASPGVVKHIEGNRYPLGELDGTTTERITRIAQAFTAAGLKSPILDNIRAEIWLKLWGNLTFNPISALTHSTLVDLCQYPLTRTLAQNMMSRGAGDRRQAGHRLPRVDREAHRGRGEGRQAQDLDAAGHRGGTGAGDRCAGRFGDRAGSADGHVRRRTSTRSTRSSSSSPTRSPPKGCACAR